MSSCANPQLDNPAVHNRSQRGSVNPGSGPPVHTTENLLHSCLCRFPSGPKGGVASRVKGGSLGAGLALGPRGGVEGVELGSLAWTGLGRGWESGWGAGPGAGSETGLGGRAGPGLEAEFEGELKPGGSAGGGIGGGMREARMRGRAGGGTGDWLGLLQCLPVSVNIYVARRMEGPQGRTQPSATRPGR